MRALLLAALLILPVSPDPTNLDSMERTYRCGQYALSRVTYGWIAIEKYTPMVYYHGRGTAPFNKVASCQL